MKRDSLTDDYTFYVDKYPEGGYSVSLPHQCDEWEILGFDGTNFKDGFSEDEWVFEGHVVVGRYPAYPTDKDLAVKQMELFIQRANEALDKLKNL